MKKNVLIILFSLLFIFVGCDNKPTNHDISSNENTDPSIDASNIENSNVDVPFCYVSGGYTPTAPGKQDYIAEINDAPSPGFSHLIDEDKIGTEINEFFDIKFNFKYDATMRKACELNTVDIYSSSQDEPYASIHINRETGYCETLSLPHIFDLNDHPESLNDYYTNYFKTEKIKYDEVELHIKAFCEKYLPHIKFDELTLYYSYDHEPSPGNYDYKIYSRYYQKNSNGVVIQKIAFEIDWYGNMVWYRNVEYADVELPNITDEQFIAMAKARIDEYYTRFDYVAEITDYIIEEKRACFYEENNSFAVIFKLLFTVHYNDGTEFQHANDFIYFYE